MTLAELLELARKVSTAGYAMPAASERLARAVVELLETPMPCSWPEPVAEHGWVTWEALGKDTLIDPETARGLIAAFARAAAEVGA
jgi:hypothetical protein